MQTPIFLRPPRHDDVRYYAAYLGDPQVTLWLEDRCQRPVLFHQAQAFVLGEAWCRLAIDFEGRFVGMTGLEDFDPANSSARFFVVVGDRSVWGKGIGSAAASRVLDYGFMTLGLRRISSNHFVPNEASRVIHERAGFHIEGRQRQVAWRNGAWVDQVLLGVLREEWLSA